MSCGGSSREYDAQYYLEDASELADADYDALKDELLSLEERYPVLAWSRPRRPGRSESPHRACSLR